ncbi:hypothetical protein [Paraburkholderia azotifigens]|uniref:Uncharacterized protein n=1 Tax=Paraburkholderia azotifigens TaxID=2057004 RepID=A0A5C6VI93_9BURK|nr:hypothetical protein [Paraburkholderia azotifigens]TXC84226.1 hypothetical protein FRZ40_28450 [Paraburkholderia azotifigens]
MKSFSWVECEWREGQRVKCCRHIAPFIARKIYVLFVIIKRRADMHRASGREKPPQTCEESPKRVLSWPHSESWRGLAGAQRLLEL